MSTLIGKHMCAEHVAHTVDINTYDKLYRYDAVRYAGMADEYGSATGVRLVLFEYLILKRTPKGAWILSSESWPWISTIPRGPDGQTVSLDKKTRREYGIRFVLLAAHKRFAAQTKERALHDFIARKRRHILILKKDLRIAEMALCMANAMSDELQLKPKHVLL